MDGPIDCGRFVWKSLCTIPPLDNRAFYLRIVPLENIMQWIDVDSAAAFSEVYGWQRSVSKGLLGILRHTGNRMIPDGGGGKGCDTSGWYHFGNSLDLFNNPHPTVIVPNVRGKAEHTVETILQALTSDSKQRAQISCCFEKRHGRERFDSVFGIRAVLGHTSIPWTRMESISVPIPLSWACTLVASATDQP